jgi:hypothetical protein
MNRVTSVRGERDEEDRLQVAATLMAHYLKMQDASHADYDRIDPASNPYRHGKHNVSREVFLDAITRQRNHKAARDLICHLLTATPAVLTDERLAITRMHLFAFLQRTSVRRPPHVQVIEC